MRYTFFLYNDESQFAEVSEEEMEQSFKVFGEYIGQLKAAGVLVDTDWLQPSPTATTVTMKDGKKRIQDGPYADTKEQLGGTFVIDVPDLDAALAWAETCPS
ncbi:MAG: YciI family protein, partial [Pseudomonadota bacterium]